MNEVTCKKCGTVYFEITLEDLENKTLYGSSPGTYRKCRSCGNDHKNFRDAKPDDAPNGCTISPILARDQ